MHTAAAGSSEPSSTPRRSSGKPNWQDRLAGLHPRLLVAELLLSGIPPFVASRLRTAGLRAAGVQIGTATNFWGFPTLVGRGNIAQRLVIGSYCGLNSGAFFDLEESITIGDHVAVGHEVMFVTSRYGAGNGTDRAGREARPIVVEDGVWLGGRCVIMPGVTIGKSSVIGAGVVVSSNVKENTLLTGAPPISIARWR